MYATLGADQTAWMNMLVWAFHAWAFFSYMYATLGADQTAWMNMLVWAFIVRTCMLHKALIRLRGCACLPGLLLFVHVCYIRR